MNLRRISPFRWTWEWLCIFLLPFVLFWHEFARYEIGDIDIAMLERGGIAGEAELTRISGGPDADFARTKGPFAYMWQRMAFFDVDLTWQDSAGVKRQARNVHVDPDLGMAHGFRAPDRPERLRVPIRYLPRDGVRSPPGVVEQLGTTPPACSPWENCNVTVVDRSGSMHIASQSRFWHVWGGWLMLGCVGGLPALIVLRWCGVIGRLPRDAGSSGG